MTGLARSRSGADTKGCARMVLVTSACRVSQLQEVVDGADHRPFASDLVEAPQQELPKASGMFDLPEHRLAEPRVRLEPDPAPLAAAATAARHSQGRKVLLMRPIESDSPLQVEP